MIEHWYLTNIQMLMNLWGTVDYDDTSFTWIRIFNFDLPPIFCQSETVLLFLTPGYNIENYNDYHFFVDMALKRQDGSAPPFVHENNGYNNLHNHGYARLSFHLKSFRPSTDVVSAHNFLELAKAVYHFLGRS